jgi:hypothetical protein
MLAVGYLGFDVPVYQGGDLGVPIPTFQRLEGKLVTAPQGVGPLSLNQSQFGADQMALKSLAESNPDRALRLMREVAGTLGGSEFSQIAGTLMAPNASPAKPIDIQGLVQQFKLASVNYVSVNGREGPRYVRYDEAFAQAFSDSEKSGK